MSDRAKQIEQFVLATIGGVMLPVPVKKVCELLLVWDAQFAGSANPELIPSERRCAKCNYRKSGTGEVKCPVDGSVMVEVTWKEACLAASRIASTARKRVDLLESAWPAEHAIPVGHEIDTKSLEEKIDILREKGLTSIDFAREGVRIVFTPEDLPSIVVGAYYGTFDEAVNAEYGRRK